MIGAGGVLAAHGPSSLQATWVNPIPDQTAGFTWDGGPRPQAPLIMFAPFPIGRSQPLVHAIVGAVAGDTNDAAEIVEDCQRLEQHPRLQTSDEGTVSVASIADRAFAPSVWQIENAWETFGPLAAREPLFVAAQRYTEVSLEMSRIVCPTHRVSTELGDSTTSTDFCYCFVSVVCG